MTAYTPIQAGYRRRRHRRMRMTVLLALLTLSACIAMLWFGNTQYAPDILLRVLLGENVPGAAFAIRTLRLPRMLAGLMSGLAFGMAGSVFQTMLHNPLASPDIIGITSGSGVAAVFCLLILHISGPFVSLAAVIAGLIVALFIYLLSKGGGFSGGRLILIGIGVQAMLNALISFLLLRASQYDIPGAMRWLSGSLNGMQQDDLMTLFPVLLLGTPVLLGLGRHLKILELGEQSAITLGLNTDRSRLVLVMTAVLLIAFATAVTGPIAFVSFLSGPIASNLIGRGEPNVPAAGLVGALLVLAADLIGQFTFGTRFPVGIITGILGAPYLLFLLIQLNRKGGSA